MNHVPSPSFVRPLCGLLPLGVAAILTACSPPKAPTTPPPPRVTVAHPQIGVVTNWDEYPGHIEAVEMVEIRPRVAGYLESIHFQDGAEVKAGDLLFVIDQRPYQADLEHAQAERQQAESRLELAKNDLKRVENLQGTRAISEEEYDTRNKAARAAESALAAVQAAENTARINLDYTRVKAPISGRIGRRLVTMGNLVQGGGMMPGTVLATLVSVDPVYCYFDAEESAFLKYRRNTESKEGTTAGCLAGELALVNETGYPHPGRVDFFDNQVDAKTGTIRMRGTFANPDRQLVPGMFAKVRVPAGPPVEALLVPAVAIGSDQGNKFVLVVNATNTIEPRPIKVDRQHGAMRAVTGGITPEDRVVVNGLMMARPGTKVEVVDAPSHGGKPTLQAQR